MNTGSVGISWCEQSRRRISSLNESWSLNRLVWTNLNTDVDMETRWTVLRDLRINEYVMNLEWSDPNQKVNVWPDNQ